MYTVGFIEEIWCKDFETTMRNKVTHLILTCFTDHNKMKKTIKFIEENCSVQRWSKVKLSWCVDSVICGSVRITDKLNIIREA